MMMIDTKKLRMRSDDYEENNGTFRQSTEEENKGDGDSANEHHQSDPTTNIIPKNMENKKNKEKQSAFIYNNLILKTKLTAFSEETDYILFIIT